MICNEHIAKLILEAPERVLCLAAYREFAVFDVPFPVDCVVRYMRQFSGTAVNAAVNYFDGLVVPYSFRSSLAVRIKSEVP